MVSDNIHLPEAVVLAEKTCFKGQLFGHVSSGGGLLAISHGIALKFIALNDKYVTVQVITSGIGKPIKSQSWQKTKKVVQKMTKVPRPTKPKPKEIKLTDTIDTENLI